MRSRLEADFAQFLDTWSNPGDWAYEPQCFAGQSGQYLPDFGIGEPPAAQYVEVKPRDWHGDINGLLRNMTVIWESEPQAQLHLFLWSYGQWDEYVLFTSGRGGSWNRRGPAREFGHLDGDHSPATFAQLRQINMHFRRLGLSAVLGRPDVPGRFDQPWPGVRPPQGIFPDPHPNRLATAWVPA
jgi:hypothetical protein